MKIKSRINFCENSFIKRSFLSVFLYKLNCCIVKLLNCRVAKNFCHLITIQQFDNITI